MMAGDCGSYNMGVNNLLALAAGRASCGHWRGLRRGRDGGVVMTGSDQANLARFAQSVERTRLLARSLEACSSC